MTFNKFISSFFTIVGSKVIRPDSDYHLAITSQGYKEPTLYRVSINGTTDDGQPYLQSKDITLLNDQTQTLFFDVSSVT
jgi:CD109 antigen